MEEARIADSESIRFDAWRHPQQPASDSIKLAGAAIRFEQKTLAEAANRVSKIPHSSMIGH